MTDDSLSDRLLADADPPETPDECPMCGADMSIESAVFCSVTCQVEAADRLDAAEKCMFDVQDILMNGEGSHEKRATDAILRLEAWYGIERDGEGGDDE